MTARQSASERAWEMLGVFGAALVALLFVFACLAGAVFLATQAISHVDCTINPTSARCVAIDARDRYANRWSL